MWTPIQFDSAVMTFGRHIEYELSRSKLSGPHVLEALLDITPDPRELMRRNSETSSRLDMILAGKQR